MKYAIVGSLTALLAGAGLALAQQPDEALPPPRNLSAANNDVPADPGAAAGLPGGPGAGPTYGPPPLLLAPVCPGPGTPFRFWTEGDYHAWWLKKNGFPPLLESLATGNNPTEILVGGDSLDRSLRNGGGLTIGGWITDYQGFGVEASFFVMESASKSFNFGGSGGADSPVIVRPYFNVTSGQPAVLPISAPGLASGSATGASQGLEGDSGRFAGISANMIGNICCDPTSRWDFLIGYRYLTLDDRFSMGTDSTSLTSPGSTTTTASSPTSSTVVTVPAGTLMTTINDTINTSNRFNGANFGLRGQWYYDRWLFKAAAMVAFGSSEETATLSGQTTQFAPGITTTTTTVNPATGFIAASTTSITTPASSLTFPSGFLVRPSNIGTITRETFTIVPEIDLTVAYQCTDWMRFTFGYSFLYWSSVSRSGDQVNLKINPNEVPAIVTPSNLTTVPSTATLRQTNFWAQGINLGLEFRY
jgi:Putative beta barrel porin-7 (BBP7)